MQKWIKSVLISFIGFCLFSGQLYAKEQSNMDTAIFAGGCFWCLASDMDKVPGVVETISGYIGGDVAHPTYQQVSQGGTGHFEAVKVVYDPAKVTYQQLLTAFWHDVDPTDAKGQFCDKGDQYRSAIFYLNDEQKRWAEASKSELEKSGKVKQVATLILPAKTFYPAEDYHQNYYKKNPLRYQYYRFACGRDKRLKAVWGQ